MHVAPFPSGRSGGLRNPAGSRSRIGPNRLTFALMVGLIPGCVSIHPRHAPRILEAEGEVPLESRDLPVQNAATVFGGALQAYDEGLRALAAEEWDSAYGCLGDASDLMIYESPPDDAPDPLMREHLKLLSDEVERLLTEIEPRVTAALVARRAAGMPGAVDSTPEPGPYDLPVVRNYQVDHFLATYTGPQHGSFERRLARSGRYRSMMAEILEEERVPRDLLWLPIIESGMSPSAVSRARAVGLWQFIESTGRRYGLRPDVFEDPRRDPVRATRAAARHLRDLHDRFQSWPLALAAYNCGAGCVQRAIDRAGTRDYWRLKLPRETREYVPRFFAAVILARNPEQHGFNPSYEPPLQYDLVEAPALMHFELIAECAEASEKQIRHLNPHFHKGLTPPLGAPWVRIPVGHAEAFRKNLEKIPPQRFTSMIDHKIRPGETLSSIANRYGSSVATLTAANQLASAHRIRAGKVLTVPILSRSKARARANVASSSRVRRKKGAPAPPSEPSRAGYATTGGDYRVRRGDTLSGIARAHEVSLKQLLSVNGLSVNSVIFPDKALLIPGVGRDYMVRAGDSLERIARAQGVSTTELARRNDISMERPLIHPGQTLRVPGTPGSPRSHTHEVEKGESVYAIAERYGVETEEILRWNSLSPSALIHPGDHLTVWF